MTMPGPASSSIGDLHDPTPFDFAPRTRIVFGTDIVDDLGQHVTNLGAKRAFIVTDEGLVAAGHVERAERCLRHRGVDVRRFDRVRENPTSADIDACRSAVGDDDVDVFIGLGGGSSIDVAKGCNFVFAGGGSIADFEGRGTARGTLRPMIAIPTTAGTGSEVQSFALVGDDATHRKMACGDVQAMPCLALLDPTLTVSQPRFVTACTGLDAIGHAVETAVTRVGTPVSRMYAVEAFRLLNENFPRVLATPNDLEARGAMLVGAAWAGMAIEHSMLGAAHSMANPLTAHDGIVHGQAVAMTLPVVVGYNGVDARARAGYAELVRVMRSDDIGRANPAGSDDVERLVARLRELLRIADISANLRDHGVTKASLPQRAHEAASQWTAQFNPRAIGEDDFGRLYEKAWAGEDA